MMNPIKKDARAKGIEKRGIIYPHPDADPMWLLNPQPLWTLDDIARATGGSWVNGYRNDVTISGVCYRKNEILAGDLYVPRNSKHWAKKNLPMPDAQALKTAFSKGTAAVIVSHVPDGLETDMPVLKVKNTRKALYALADFARSRFQGKVVGVTGSAGKTSIKEMLRYLLAQVEPSVSSRANFNHDVGVALSLAQTPPQMSYAVYEFGVDAPHLTAMKAHMLQPDIAIVTDIHEAHLSHYKTLDKLVEQKSLLFDAVTQQGTVILNHDSVFFEKFRNLARAKQVSHIVSYGKHPHADFCLKRYAMDARGSDVVMAFNQEEVAYRVALPGYHNIQNSLAVLAAISCLGENVPLAADNLKLFSNIRDRTEFHTVKLDTGGSYQIIDDVFNANSGSIKAGLKLLSLMAATDRHRKIVVLGQMKKPGDETARLHSELAGPIIENNVDKVYTLGQDMLHLREALPEPLLGAHGETYLDIIDALISELKADDILFLKGPDPSKQNTKKIVSHLLNAEAGSTKQPAQVDKNKLQKNRSDKTEIVTHLDQSNFSCLFAGDTSFGESYQERYHREGEGNILELKGYDYPLQKMHAMLLNCDRVIANLETPLTNLSESVFAQNKTWLHRSDTQNSPKYLLKHNIKVVGLANNHSMDYGKQGFRDTLDTLSRYGFSFFGGGSTLSQAQKPYIETIRLRHTTFKMAVISSYKVLKKAKEVYAMYADQEQAGVNPLSTGAIKRQIDTLKQSDPDILVILFPHWGANYAWRTDNQQKLAHAMIDAGADLIIGHGAHMMQEIERYKDKWIIYSLGNFMFNSRGRYKKYQAPPYSLLARLDVSENARSTAIQLKLFPIFTNNRITRFQPRFVDGIEMSQILALLSKQGSHLDSGHLSAEQIGDEALFCLQLEL